MAFDLETSKYLLELLRCSLSGRIPKDKPRAVSWDAVYAMAKRHGVSALAFYPLAMSPKACPPVLEPELLEKWKVDYSKAIVKSGNQEFELECISRALAEAQIPHMPLKGSCIRALFAVPALREMSDLDILVPAEQMDEASQVLMTQGYQKGHTNGHHTEFLKHPYICVELHKELMSPDNELYFLVHEPWSFARQTSDSYRFEMSLEDQYFYLVLHAAKHYYHCGTGIRSVLDVYLYRKHFGTSLNWDYLEKKFAPVKLRSFRLEIEALAEHWFGQGNVEIGEMAFYILDGATYGSVDGRAVNIVRKKLEQGKGLRRAKLSYYFSLVFLPLQEMRYSYPALVKAPALLPAFWVVRWLKILVHRPGNIVKRYKASMDIQIYSEKKHKQGRERREADERNDENR